MRLPVPADNALAPRVAMDRIAPKRPSNAKLDPWLSDVASAPIWRRRLILRAQGYPRFLYKYRTFNPGNATSIDRLRDLLVRSRFWLSSPGEFNDPFDMSSQMVFEGTAKEKKARIRDLVRTKSAGKKKARRELEARLLKKSSAEVLANASAAFERSRREFGVYSFAGDPRSILMWSHYGTDHEGICLQFDLARDVHTFAFAMKVDYTDEYPEINFARETQPQLNRGLLRKFRAWEYEGERRIIIAAGARSFQSFRPEALIGIILGSRTTPKAEEQVRAILAERAGLGLPKVQTYRTWAHESRYALVVKRA